MNLKNLSKIEENYLEEQEEQKLEEPEEKSKCYISLIILKYKLIFCILLCVVIVASLDFLTLLVNDKYWGLFMIQIVNKLNKNA